MTTLAQPRARTPARRGWTMVLAALLAMIPSTSAISFYSQNLFIGPVTRETGWTTTQFLAPVSVGLLIAAFLPPFVGFAADRFGVRVVQIPGLILYGLGAVALGLIGSSLTQYVVLSIVIGLASVSQSPVFYGKIVAGWFDAKRGLALGIATSGLALGNILFPPLTSLLIADFGWRVARIALGSTLLLLALPIAWGVLRERSEETRPAAPTGPAGELEGLSFAESLRSRAFWQINAALILASLAINGHLVSLVGIVAPKGIDPPTAALALSAMAICMFVGRILSGRLLDALAGPQIGALWFGLATIGAFLLHFSEGVGPVFVSTAMLGFALGAEIELAAYYVTRYFGLRNFGQLYGINLCVYSAAAAIGPILMSVGADRTGSYMLPGLILSACAAVATFLLFALPPYRFEPEN